MTPGVPHIGVEHEPLLDFAYYRPVDGGLDIAQAQKRFGEGDDGDGRNRDDTEID